eukprot:SAG11_NODE_1308_length_5239_cov_12.108366_3_plen_375_part_00
MHMSQRSKRIPPSILLRAAWSTKPHNWVRTWTQLVQEVDPAAAYCPAAQEMQATCAAEGVYCPAGHVSHGVAGLLSASAKPASQFVQDGAAAPTYCPALHNSHVPAFVTPYPADDWHDEQSLPSYPTLHVPHSTPVSGSHVPRPPHGCAGHKFWHIIQAFRVAEPSDFHIRLSPAFTVMPSRSAPAPASEQGAVKISSKQTAGFTRAVQEMHVPAGSSLARRTARHNLGDRNPVICHRLRGEGPGRGAALAGCARPQAKPVVRVLLRRQPSGARRTPAVAQVVVSEGERVRGGEIDGRRLIGHRTAVRARHHHPLRCRPTLRHRDAHASAAHRRADAHPIISTFGRETHGGRGSLGRGGERESRGRLVDAPVAV